VSADDTVAGLTCDEVREMAGSFVLGALDATADAAVRAHLADCPEVHEEIAELGGVVVALAESVPLVEPPAGLKGRILAAAAATPQIAASPPAAVAGTSQGSQPTPFPTAIEREARRSRVSAAGWILRIAAVVAIVGLGGWNVLLQGQVNAAKTYERSVAAVIEMAAEPGSLTAILAADGGHGSGLAAVDARGDISIAMHDLAPTSGASVYTAWIIGSDGVPVPLGSFTVDAAGIASFQSKDLPPAAGTVIALTLEPGPGATTPTLPIISKGVTKPAA
jgi:anti-sigma-K factor RskA